MILLTHENQWRGGETVAAFGTFDGVHLGHAKLMSHTNELAALHDLTSVVYTFSSHPTTVFAPESAPRGLHTRSEKIRAIADKGVDVVVMRPFERVYAAMSPEAFVHTFVNALHPRHVVIGFNYTFGAKGAGRAEDMIRLGDRFGFETHVISAVMLDGEPVSSTRVREAVQRGDMELAMRLLGRPYPISGKVQRGKQLGRKLDFPTANLSLPRAKVLPPCGVYAARAFVRDHWYIAAVNIGKHPTAPQGAPTIEANLLDYSGKEFYDAHMRLLLYRQVREERRFSSLDALREEVLRNREQVRAYFGH